MQASITCNKCEMYALRSSVYISQTNFIGVCLMTNYIIRRLLIMPITLIGVTMLIFGMLSFLESGRTLGPVCARYPAQ